MREIERERASLAGRARETDLAPEEPGDLAADRETEPGPSVLAARRAVRLLEGFEDDLLLLSWDTDARVGDRERDHRSGAVQGLDRGAPAAGRRVDAERDPASLRELERVREQVLDDLLEPLRVGEDRPRDSGTDLDREIEALDLGDVAERALHVIDQVGEAELSDVDDDRARLDLREIEDVVDQVQQVLARGVDRLRELGLFAGQVAVRVAGELIGENEEAVERGPELVGHVGEEL